MGKLVQQWWVMGSLLLPILMAGCAGDSELHALRVNTATLERQSTASQQTVEVRVQQLSDRLTQFEQAQAATRRDVARVAATLDELRVQLQRLQGTIQETKRQAQRGTTEGEGASATRLTNVETRLRMLQKQLSSAP